MRVKILLDVEVPTENIDGMTRREYIEYVCSSVGSPDGLHDARIDCFELKGRNGKYKKTTNEAIA